MDNLYAIDPQIAARQEKDVNRIRFEEMKEVAEDFVTYLRRVGGVRFLIINDGFLLANEPLIEQKHQFLQSLIEASENHIRIAVIGRRSQALRDKSPNYLKYNLDETNIGVVIGNFLYESGAKDKIEVISKILTEHFNGSPESIFVIDRKGDLEYFALNGINLCPANIESVRSYFSQASFDGFSEKSVKATTEMLKTKFITQDAIANRRTPEAATSLLATEEARAETDRIGTSVTNPTATASNRSTIIQYSEI